MMAKIREDLVGAIHVDGFVLVAGDDVPEGVRVGAHLTGEEPAPEDDKAAMENSEDGFDPFAEEPAPTKPRGRPRKSQ